MTFQYQVNGSRRRISEERILGGIRKLSKRLGARSPRRSEFDRWRGRPCTSTVAAARFGTWNQALARAGLRPVARVRKTPEELIAALEKAWKSLERAPGDLQLRHLTGLSPSPYLRHWGGVRAACEALASFHRGEITREQLLAGRPRLAARKSLLVTVKWRVLLRDRYRCVLCGKSPATDEGIKLEVDHITPVCLGGSDAEANLRTLCRGCHVKKTWRGEEGTKAEGTP